MLDPVSNIIAINIHNAIVSAWIEKKILSKHRGRIILELILTHCVNRKKRRLVCECQSAKEDRATIWLKIWWWSQKFYSWRIARPQVKMDRTLYFSKLKNWPRHCMFLVHWNRHFHVNLMRGLPKNAKKKSQWLFEIIQIIRFEMHMDRLNKSENIFGI